MPSKQGAHPGTYGPTFSSIASAAATSKKPLSKDIEDRRGDVWTPRLLKVNQKITNVWEGKGLK